MGLPHDAGLARQKHLRFSMQEIRIGIIGAGTNTKLMHIPKLQEIPGVYSYCSLQQIKASSEKVAKEVRHSQNIPQLAGTGRR